VQPADVSEYAGVSLDVRGDGGVYTFIVSTTDGRWVSTFVAGDEWRTVEFPFASMEAPAEGAEWSGDNILDIRVLIKRAGGEVAWFELDEVRLY
ncbi:CIA30 family protein, partial [Hyphomonas sp.]|uniref:CIA30 family protein n=1 Tax=Hyphomonas sp. TaxID=87 RepID=UPI0032425756